MVEQPRGKPREAVAMIHLRAVRDFARVDHGLFLPLVSCTHVSKYPSPESVTISSFHLPVSRYLRRPLIWLPGPRCCPPRHHCRWRAGAPPVLPTPESAAGSRYGHVSSACVTPRRTLPLPAR